MSKLLNMRYRDLRPLMVSTDRERRPRPDAARGDSNGLLVNLDGDPEEESDKLFRAMRDEHFSRRRR